MTKEELIKKHLEGWIGLKKASIQHFAESGKASGSFFMALKLMLDEYAQNEVNKISSNVPVIKSVCEHDWKITNGRYTRDCRKCGEKR